MSPKPSRGASISARHLAPCHGQCQPILCASTTVLARCFCQTMPHVSSNFVGPNAKSVRIHFAQIPPDTPRFRFAQFGRKLTNLTIGTSFTVCRGQNEPGRSNRVVGIDALSSRVSDPEFILGIGMAQKRCEQPRISDRCLQNY